MFTYLLINICSISIPLVYSFHSRLKFNETWYAFWPAVAITATVFIIWDVLFTSWGIWGFNPAYLIGFSILGLPLEEWLFFLCIPYACVFTYASLKKIFPSTFFDRCANAMTMLIIILFILVAGFNSDRLYTVVTFSATAVLLTLHVAVIKPNYLGNFYLAYLVIFLMPFLIVNGLLTGSMIPDEVVWYNNFENLGKRFLTIPLEDFIYGLLLFLMNVTLYERFIEKRERNRSN